MPRVPLMLIFSPVSLSPYATPCHCRQITLLYADIYAAFRFITPLCCLMLALMMLMMPHYAVFLSLFESFFFSPPMALILPRSRGAFLSPQSSPPPAQALDAIISPLLSRAMQRVQSAAMPADYYALFSFADTATMLRYEAAFAACCHFR